MCCKAYARFSQLFASHNQLRTIKMMNHCSCYSSRRINHGDTFFFPFLMINACQNMHSPLFNIHSRILLLLCHYPEKSLITFKTTSTCLTFFGQRHYCNKREEYKTTKRGYCLECSVLFFFSIPCFFFFPLVFKEPLLKVPAPSAMKLQS